MITTLIVILAGYILLGLLATLYYYVFVAAHDASGDGAGMLLIAWLWPYAFIYLPIKWKIQAMLGMKVD